jgi:hypothetical protein
MGDVKILTSDQDVVDDANPQRYYIYKEATIEGAEAPAVEAAPVVAEPVEAAPMAETVAAAAEEKVNETATEVKEEVHETAAVAEEKVNETAAAAEKKAEEQPGFESIFAITGLLAVAYLVLGRRE